MKLGACGGTYARYGEDRYLKMKQHGFDCVDFSLAGTDSIYYKADENECKRLLEAEAARIREAGMTLYQIHGPWRWPSQDATEEDRAERMDKMKRSIHMCAVMGCRYWVVHPIMPFGIQERGNAEQAAQTWELNRAFMRELIQTAHEEDVVICLENMPMPNFSMGKVEDIIRFVNEMNDDHFKVCLDTGHAAVTREGVGDAVRALGKDLLRTLHIHDNNGIHDQHRLPYFGVIDWEDFAAALQEIGFDGNFSYEVTNPASMPDPIFEQIMLKDCAAIARHLMRE